MQEQKEATIKKGATLDIVKFAEMMKRTLSPEMFRKIFDDSKDKAIAHMLKTTWRGIDLLDREAADLVCTQDNCCWRIWMPPQISSFLSAFYDRDNPDVDKAIIVEVTLEMLAVRGISGDPRTSATRKGNKAVFETCYTGCQCPLVHTYKVIEPTPNLCSCVHNLYPGLFQELYNIPVKARILESCLRGGSHCAFEWEFPEEMIKTPEFKFFPTV